MEAEMAEGFMTVNEFMRIYGVPRSTLYRLVRDPASGLRIVKIGRASRISRADAETWAANLPTLGGQG